MEKNPVHDWLKTITSKNEVFENLHLEPRHVLEAFTAGLAPLKALTVIQMEMITWSSRRAQAVLSIPQRLSGCKTHEDLLEEHNRFWQTAYTQNQEAAFRIAQAWSDLLGIPSSFTSSKDTKTEHGTQSLIKFPSKREDKGGESHKKKAPTTRDVFSS